MAMGSTHSHPSLGAGMLPETQLVVSAPRKGISMRATTLFYKHLLQRQICLPTARVFNH